MNKKDRKDLAERLAQQADSRRANKAHLLTPEPEDMSLDSALKRFHEHARHNLYKFAATEPGIQRPKVYMRPEVLVDFGVTDQSISSMFADEYGANHRRFDTPVYSMTIKPNGDADSAMLETFWNQSIERRRQAAAQTNFGKAFLRSNGPADRTADDGVWLDDEIQADFLRPKPERSRAQKKIDESIEHITNQIFSDYLWKTSNNTAPRESHARMDWFSDPALGARTNTPDVKTYEEFRGNYLSHVQEHFIQNDYQDYLRSVLESPTPHYTNADGIHRSWFNNSPEDIKAQIESFNTIFSNLNKVEESVEYDADAAYQAELERKMQNDT